MCVGNEDIVDFTKQLNDKQLEAVLYNDGPLLILAGAGSGKTRVLTYKMAYLIGRCGIYPDEILGVTFTNKAANEMKERVVNLLGARRPLWVSTFHSACVRILRRDIEKIGMSKNFIIYDEYDKTVKIKEILKNLGLNDKRLTPGSVIASISQAKNADMDAEKYARSANDYFTQIISQIYGIYDRQMQKDNALDFDDLLMKTVRLFKNNPEVLGNYQNKFKYILVDEYQDINYIQYLMIRALADKHLRLCVVGDDDQSIYGFRGADISIILQFEKDFPNSKVVKLEQNYRSTKTILEAANSVVKNNAGRKHKKLWTENKEGELIATYSAYNEEDEGRFVARKIKELAAKGEYNLRDFAILYRTNAQSRAIEEFLLSTALPYKIVGGVKFYERKEIKDIIAYLRVIFNPNDTVSLMRIINTPSRGIGKTTLDKINQYAALNNISCYTALRQIDCIAVQDGARKKIKDFMGIIEEMQSYLKDTSVTDTSVTDTSVAGTSVAGIIKIAIEKTGLRAAYLKENTADAIARVENLDEFISVGYEFENKTEDATLENFLAEAALLSDIDSYEENADAVTLMTLHSSKGLEFPVVFITGLEEGIFPHARSLYSITELEEERRLCYVGITRAREKLYLLSARSRTIFGTTGERQLSRFLEEIEADFLEDETPRQTAASSEVYVDKGKYDAEKDGVIYKFTKGQNVVHHLWGKGVVCDVEDEEVSVKFEKLGTKIILAEYLKPVKGGNGIGNIDLYKDADIGDKIEVPQWGSGIILNKDTDKIIASFPKWGVREIVM